jgi:hypothetical protein
MPEKIHCSAAPRTLACPSSLIPPKTPRTDVSGEPARLGTFVHELVALVVTGKDLPDDLPERARARDVPIQDVAILVAIWAKIWRALAVHFPEPHAEVKLESELLIGTADIVHHDGATAAVADPKTGWLDGEHAAQVTGYACCMREMWGIPQSGHIMAAPVHLRSDSMDVLQLDDDALDAFEVRVRKAIGQAGEVYGPGEACTYCKRSHECEQRAEWLSGQARLVSRIDPTEITPADIARLYPAVKIVEDACKAFRAAARSVVQVHGPQPVDDERELRLLDVRDRTVDPIRLRDVMKREPYNWTMEQLYPIFGVSKTRLKAAVREGVAKGFAAKTERRLFDNLEKAGAVTTSMRQQLRILKK